jgi:hypothetical protein
MDNSVKCFGCGWSDWQSCGVMICKSAGGNLCNACGLRISRKRAAAERRMAHDDTTTESKLSDDIKGSVSSSHEKHGECYLERQIRTKEAGRSPR